jgi:hypothetical protein
MARCIGTAGLPELNKNQLLTELVDKAMLSGFRRAKRFCLYF